MDPLPLPPRYHVLRPHDVAILAIFALTFKEFENKLPPSFLLHVHRVLLNEVSEVALPKSHQELINDLAASPQANSHEPGRLIATFKGVHADLHNVDRMTSFFHSLPATLLEKPDSEDPPVIARRSLFGYYIRKTYATFTKLSYSGVVKLQEDYKSWCKGANAGYNPVIRDQLDSADLLIWRTQSDKKIWAQPDTFEIWEKGRTTGDENIATENLRRFFEQHFHENNDSGIRHHALLSLVRMHYVRHEYVAASKLLQEAITVSRTSGDRVTLQHCISMLHRLPPTDPHRQKYIINEIQPDLNPLEVLFDVKKLMITDNEQPLSASFERILLAVGLYDQWADIHSVPAVDYEQFSHHAVQAIVWSAAGCSRIAKIEEDILLTFTEIGSDDNNRITVIINQVYQRARKGQYNEALTMLLNPDVWRGLTLDDCGLWASQIWHILVLRAIRSGQDRLYRDFLLPHRPFGTFNAKYYCPNETSGEKDVINDPLYDVIRLRECGQATSAIEELLTALWHSEFQGRLNLYRTAIILLADVSLEFGMTKRSRKLLDEIMPQVINGDEIEQRGLACFTLARCVIAAGDSKAEALQQALPYLLMAEADFSRLQMLRPLMDVQYLASVIHHNLDQEIERDDAIRRHWETEGKLKSNGEVVVDEQVKEIWEVVTQIGSALAAR